MTPHPIDELVHPRSVAVVGASTNLGSWGYAYVDHFIEYGFRGDIYPVNPRYSEVAGYPCYSSVRDIPGHVDYVISCVPASGVLDLIDDCAAKGVRVIHLYTARFSETGRDDAAALEQEVLARARQTGIRLIGPNCMGLYYPGHGISFGYRLPKEAGPVGMLSQSGGGASSFVLSAGQRGLRFSKVFSYGNALDFTECDFLDYLTDDPDTRVITIYTEGIREGRRFVDSLRRAAAVKPVIAIKGGRGESGTRAVESHTASLAGSTLTWGALIRQAGAIPVANFDEMTDVAVSLCFPPPILGPRVGIAGGGGGLSVLTADACEEAGLDVAPLSDDICRELKARGSDIWDWIGNPVDVSIIGGGGPGDLEMLSLMGASNDFDLLIGLVNVTTMLTLAQREGVEFRLGSVCEGYSKIVRETGKPLLAVLPDDTSGSDLYGNWSGTATSRLRTDLITAGIPFYPTVERAAFAARRVIDYYARRETG